MSELSPQDDASSGKPNHKPKPGKNTSASPSIYLDYGIDGATNDDSPCEICERGMRFRSRWRFEIGTLINIAFTFDDGELQRIETEALVIETRPAESGGSGHRITLAFVDLAEEHRLALSKVSAKLVFPSPSSLSHSMPDFKSTTRL